MALSTYATRPNTLQDLFNTFLFTLNVTTPIFVLVFLGAYLYRIQWISEGFISTGSKIVFNLALPALIFNKIINVNLSEIFSFKQVGFAVGATLIGFLIVWQHSKSWQQQPDKRGVFVQGAFRGNMGIIGIALCANLYGDEGLALGSILLACLTLAYNILSVYALTAPFHNQSSHSIGPMVKDLARNPLIIAILAGLLCNTQQIIPGAILQRSLDYLSDLTLPLALLCVGASINLQALKQQSTMAWWACAYKLALLPLLFITTGLWMEFSPLQLGTLFLMFASPTATASYIMAKAMGSDSVLAANIIALSTCLSLFSLSIGVFILRSQGLI